MEKTEVIIFHNEKKIKEAEKQDQKDQEKIALLKEKIALIGKQKKQLSELEERHQKNVEEALKLENIIDSLYEEDDQKEVSISIKRVNDEQTKEETEEEIVPKKTVKKVKKVSEKAVEKEKEEIDPVNQQLIESECKVVDAFAESTSFKKS